MNESRSIPRDSRISAASAIVDQVYHWLDRVPYWLLALPLRVAVAWVFWSSAMTHLANWEATLDLFETEYQLPFLASGPAAYMAVSIEVTTPSFSSWGC